LLERQRSDESPHRGQADTASDLIFRNIENISTRQQLSPEESRQPVVLSGEACGLVKFPLRFIYNSSASTGQGPVSSFFNPILPP